MRANALLEQAYLQRTFTTYNLDRIRILDAEFGYPHRSYRTVHVAGTNGKGSVTAKVSKILQEAAYKVGTYISPHIIDITERIRVNGDKIPIEELDAFLAEVVPADKQLTDFGSFFEVTTLAAFLHFKKKQVDVAVIEVGLGGELDATNIITPVVSVITSISLDHTEVLGNTELEIARQKAGIIKPGVPCVIGPHTPIEFLREFCQNLGAPFYVVPQSEGFETFEEENNRISRAVAEVLRQQSFDLTDEAIEKGLLGKQPLRFYNTEYTRANDSVPLVIDVGHNQDGVYRLLTSVRASFPDRRIRAVLGMSSSKNLAAAFEIVFSIASIVNFVSANHPRLKPFNELRQLAQESFSDKIGECGLVSTTLIRVLDSAESDEVVVIFGSFFIMKDVYEVLGPAGVTLDSL